VCGTPLRGARRVVALPGSFNPPHRAHFALLDAAREAWQADAAAFVLSARTVDKEQVSGLWLEDRLWLMCQLAGEAAGQATGVVVTNRGLYAEQAVALHALCPGLQALAFVTGYDKIVQIFDPRYYDDRDAALDLLFSRASFLVAPRAAASAADLAALLGRPENSRYAPQVQVLPIAGDLAEVSSTRARDRGDLADVPDLAADFIRATGCYLTPQPAAYAARGAAIRAAARARES
jgi:nicotinic acid mononucleotide adenylyltransferase